VLRGQVVLTIPKRLRACCLYRRLLVEIARVAARTVTSSPGITMALTMASTGQSRSTSRI
jgi:hypothetical protein